MTELRRDAVTGNWVVVATERARRPDHFRKSKAKDEECPFCYGQEKMTPPETLAYRTNGGAPDSPGWSVRVVPNKYPVFVRDASLRPSGSGLYYSVPSAGGHEVIIHSPDHEKSLPELPIDQVALVIRAYRDRYLFFKGVKEVDFIEIILNHGKDAGASLEHSHSQLFAMPLVPPAAQDQLAGAADYMLKNSRCIYCDIVETERENGVRAIADEDGFFAFMPYASRLPFESWILPLEHQAFFEEIDEASMRSLAKMLILILGRYNEVLSKPSYNLFLHTTPCKSEDRSYHWHIEIIPKLTAIAGFEFGTGMMINISTPEDAAAFMRGEKSDQ
ncbi:MAG: galactose-1-phosphate uridylyltransferase [Actinobacteria bacterium]|nr:galactose-1-phosphate uridylyltransferase [Actinomycetota bacterium]